MLSTALHTDKTNGVTELTVVIMTQITAGSSGIVFANVEYPLDTTTSLQTNLYTVETEKKFDNLTSNTAFSIEGNTTCTITPESVNIESTVVSNSREPIPD